MAFVFSVAGLKNSGKTSLCMALIPHLKREGLKILYIKHTHEKIIPSSKTDTGKILELKVPTVFWGEEGVRIESAKILSLSDFQYKMGYDFDLFLLEGGKELPCPKVWLGSPETCPTFVHGVVAYYSANLQSGDDKGEKDVFLKPGEELLLAKRIAYLCRQSQRGGVSLWVDGQAVPLNAFVSDFLAGGIKGMLSALKKIEHLDKDIDIHISIEKRE
ncbi:molybdopterin-guanine dinucleotide biosynthesis protein MobB [Aminobacterium mobile]